jgi:hypothetical protein
MEDSEVHAGSPASDPAPEAPIRVEVCRRGCGEVLWRFPFRDWLGFTPDEAGMSPVEWWVAATGILVPRRITRHGKRRRSLLVPHRVLKGPSGKPDHPIVDDDTGSLTISGPSACRHVKRESVRWEEIADSLRLAMNNVDGLSPSVCRVWVE